MNTETKNEELKTEIETIEHFYKYGWSGENWFSAGAIDQAPNGVNLLNTAKKLSWDIDGQGVTLHN
jgi:hypothetical protein